MTPDAADSAMTLPRARTIATEIPVALGDRSYPVRIGPDLLARSGEAIAQTLGPSTLYPIIDEAVAALHGPAILQGLTSGPHSLRETIIVPSGEASKRFDQLTSVMDALLEQRPDRKAVIVAVGGGVIGDLAGFAAAILLRGVRFVQIPTTLLAQVDSSVGGKTGINAKAGKNLIGAFHQPSLVLADLDVLATLPPRELRAGYAEVVKYGLLGDAAFFDWLQLHGPAVLAGDAEAQSHAVASSVRAKAQVVAEDEHEAGRRALLNLGHTFGHGLEALGGYDGRLLHGEAVAAGMVMAAEFSARLNLITEAETDRIRGHLAASGLPTCAGDLPFPVDPAALRRAMSGDKKNLDGRLVLVLLQAIGDAFTLSDVDETALMTYLQAWAAG